MEEGKKKGKIGVQMMMLKAQIAEHGMYQVLKKLNEMGFHAVEVSQIAMTPDTVCQMQRAREEFGMDIAAMSCALEPFGAGIDSPFDTLRDDFDKLVADCKAVGCTILRIGMLQFSYATSFEGFIEMARKLDEYAQKLHEYGIDLYYHAHNFEFALWNKKPILTHMMEQTRHLGFELDSHWMWRGGVNPVDYLRSFKGRVRMQHLKDYKIGFPEKYDLSIGYLVFGAIEEFTEVGEGTLDMPAIIEAGLDSGSVYFMIEQDNTYGRDVYESLAISRDNLIKMGYGEWF